MRKKEDVLYIVMPAYNEGENIFNVVTAWLEVLKGKSKHSKIVIADSGSTDKTHEILLNLKKDNCQIDILEKTNQFHGPKVIALYQYAIKNKADYIFQTDSDGQTSPSEFSDFWNDRKKYDAILGHRKERGDGKSRAFVERVVCRMLRLFFGVNVPDANAPFRLMRSDLVKKYLNRIPKDYDLPNIILTAFFAYYREKIVFKEISFAPREAGVNSINFKKIFRIGASSIIDFMKFRKDIKAHPRAERTK